MTDKELNEIDVRWRNTTKHDADDIAVIVCGDVPALIAEIKRLKAITDSPQAHRVFNAATAMSSYLQSGGLVRFDRSAAEEGKEIDKALDYLFTSLNG